MRAKAGIPNKHTAAKMNQSSNSSGAAIPAVASASSDFPLPRRDAMRVLIPTPVPTAKAIISS